MANSIPSPLNFSSVRFLEVDKSQYLSPESALSFGALLYSTNGPVNDIIQLSDESTLAFLYGEPNDNNFVEWFNISRAFNYKAGIIGPTAKIARVIGDGSLNGTLGVTTSALVNSTDLTTMRIDNDIDAISPTVVFDTHSIANDGDDTVTKLKFFTKYPTNAVYKIALCNVTDFDTAEIDNGVTFKEQFSTAPTGTEVAIAVVVNNEVVEKWIVDITDGNKDGFGDSSYIETVINTKSQYILCYDNSVVIGTPVSFEATTLTKGAVVSPTNSDYLDALALFDDVEGVDINYMMGNKEVISEMITLCENRLDCELKWAAETSLIVGKASTTILNDLVTYTSTTLNRDTTYAEFFGNCALVRDKYNNKTRWVELTGDIIGLRILKNLNGNPWEASAGLNYGQLRDVIKLGWNPTPAQMNTLGKNKINPIISKRGRGIVAWGIRNYTSKNSTLTDSTTRGLVVFIWRAALRFLEQYLFEINDDITRNDIKSKIDQFMENVKSNRGVYDYRTICSEVNNTPQVIDQGQLIVELRIKPTRISKEIVLVVGLYSSGADLTIDVQ